jgi:hypothetical protein
VTRLSQIIAVEKDQKTRTEQAAAFAYHQLQKSEPLTGITKKYTARDADGEGLASQSNRVQYSAEVALRDVAAKTARYLDLLGTKEATDQKATADVVLDDGTVFLKGVPVLFLLGLERQLDEELVQARKLPTLSPEYTWVPYDASQGVSVIDPPIMTTRSKKVRKYNMMAPATDRHPAQIDPVDEDVIVGDWETKHYSGCLPVERKQEIIDRLFKLIAAVKQAREEANTTTVVDFKVGDKVFGYIYGSNAAAQS